MLNSKIAFKAARGCGIRRHGGKTDNACARYSRPLEIQNGGQKFEFWHAIRDQFTTVNMGSRCESCCALSVQLLTSLRSLFRRQSAVSSPNFSGSVQRNTKTAVVDDKNSVDLDLLRFLRSYVIF